jgi:hypothetical protein
MSKRVSTAEAFRGAVPIGLGVLRAFGVGRDLYRLPYSRRR